MKYLIVLAFFMGACRPSSVPVGSVTDLCEEEGEMTYVFLNKNRCSNHFVCDKDKEPFNNNFGCGCVTKGMYECFGGSM